VWINPKIKNIWEGLFLSKYVYCIYCESSQENKVELYLKQMGYNVISALSERKIIVNGKIKNILRSIIPGYVFFENDIEINGHIWRDICKMQYMYYPLKYSDNKKHLRGKDLNFINWLKGNDGIIKISKVIEIGNKIKVIEGPLKDYEGKIVKINKRQKCAGIKLDGEGIEKIIWLSFEYMEK
jgi:transcriptional antiterminator NusG